MIADRRIGVTLMTRLSVLTAVLLTIPSTLYAVDLPVTYLVDAKGFKENVVAGGSLSFELYEDAGCTSMIGSEQAVAGTSELIVEKIKLQKVKGQRGKPPRAFRLHTVIGSVDAEGQVFLKVTGEGVIGIPSDCQPQAGALDFHQEQLDSQQDQICELYDLTGFPFPPQCITAPPCPPTDPDCNIGGPGGGPGGGP